MKIFLLITAVISVTYGFTLELPETSRLGLQSSGAQYLGGVITGLNTALTTAVEEFKPINASCMASYDAALDACGTCFNDKCTARAKDVCAPSDFELFLGNAIKFFADDVPDFFTDEIPDFFENKVGGAFVDVGGEIVDLTKDIGNFFENDVAGAFKDLGGEIEDAATDVGRFFRNAGGEIEGVVNDIGDAFEDLGEGIVDVGEDVIGEIGGVIDTIGNGVDTAVDHIGDVFVDLGEGIVDVGENVIGEIGGVVDKIGGGVDTAVNEVGDFFKDIFGRRRRRSLRARRSTQPSCSQLKADATAACQVYLSPDYCIDCGFSTTEDCPGYAAAVDKIQAASDARSWMSKATSTSYKLVKMTFNPASFNAEAQGVSGMVVEAHLFGKDMTFTVSQPVNPSEPETYGPIIAAQALQIFKSS